MQEIDLFVLFICGLSLIVDSEVTHVEWVTAADMLSRFDREEAILAPPTWICLRELVSCDSVDDVYSLMSNRDLRYFMHFYLRNRPILPNIVKTDEGFCACYPGDTKHPDSLESGKLNRTLLKGTHSYHHVNTIHSPTPRL